MQASHVEFSDSRWSLLYKAGGAAALLGAAIFPLQIIIFIAWPPPSSPIDYFEVFQDNKLIGLLNLDLLILIESILFVPLYLALYVILRRNHESLALIALALGLVATTAYVASNTSFEMLSLSDQYAAATSDAERSQLLAAGESMLALYNGTAFHVNYIVGSIAGLLFAVVMLRSEVFSKTTAYLGILAAVIGLGLYIPVIGIFISIFSVLFLWLYYILAGRRLWRLGREFEKVAA